MIIFIYSFITYILYSYMGTQKKMSLSIEFESHFK